MFKKIISLSLLVLLALHITALAHVAILETSTVKSYKSVRITPEIYNRANSDLSDLLVKDSAGNNIPYFINSDLKSTMEADSIYPLKLINSYLKENQYYFDYQVSDLPENDILATSIEVTTTAVDFAKKITLFGSYDNIHWEFLGEDTLYKVEGKSKLTLPFLTPQKFTHYRFRLENNLEKITFDTAQLKYNVTAQTETYFIETLTPKFSIEEKDKKTYISVAGIKNLKLASLTIETDSLFKRTVSTSFSTQKELYHLSFNNTTYNDTTLPLDTRIFRDDVFIVTIQNNDDSPISIKNISVKYLADELVFEGKSGASYTLHFGKDENKTAPIYDIASYQDQILKGKIDKLAIKEIKIDPPAQEEPKSNIDYKIIFNIVVVLISVFLGALILKKLSKKG